MDQGRLIRVLVLAALIAAVVTPTTGAAPPASSCSPRSPAVPTRQAWAPARRSLAPAGAISVLICRYSGLNAQPRLRLTAGIASRDRRVVAQVVQRLDGLPAGPAVPLACPSDDLSQITVTLAYPGGRDVAVSVGLTGCGTVTNGAVHRTTSGVPGQSEPGFVPWLTALLRPRAPRLDSAAAAASDRWTAETPGHRLLVDGPPPR